MNYVILLMMLVSTSILSAQSTAKPAQEAKKTAKVSSPKKVKESAVDVVNSQASQVESLLSQSFSDFGGGRVSTLPIEWITKGGQKQKPYKVSLVGVNINAWLENPQYATELEQFAKSFSVDNLLANIASNNPALRFNSPSTVQQVLKANIYAPYLAEIATNARPKLPLLFSDITRVESATPHFSIFGSAAADYPYFGRPIEGKSRKIDLGVLPGQFKELAVRFADTDIFLVAMINVIPNWLEQGLNVYQENLQKLEILVYAFDRNGHLIGGGGLPFSVKDQKIKYTVPQLANSRVWEPAVSRSFILWSSLNIANTPKIHEAQKVATYPRTINKDPYLTPTQSYILNVLAKRQANKQSLNISIFRSNGNKRVLKSLPNKAKEKSAQLVAKTPVYIDKRISFIFGEEYLTKIALDYKAQKVEKKEVKVQPEYRTTRNMETTVTKKKYQPSNEGEKLTALLSEGQTLLAQPLRKITNKVDVTNQIEEYKLYSHPTKFARAKKNHVNLSASTRNYLKLKKNQAKQDLADLKLANKEKSYWYNLLLSQKSNASLKSNITEWKKASADVVSLYKKVELLNKERDAYNNLLADMPTLKQQSYTYVQETYFANKKKVAEKKKAIDAQEKLIVAKLRVELRELEKKIAENEKQEALYNTAKTKLATIEARITPQLNSYRMVKVGFSDYIAEDNVAKIVSSITKVISVPDSVIRNAIQRKQYSPIAKKIVKGVVDPKAFELEGYSLGLSGSIREKVELGVRMRKI